MSDPFSNNTVADPFMQSGNAEAIKFDTPGQIAVLTVRKVTEHVDTDPSGTIKTWPNGDPKKVFVFSGETDEGERSLWVRGQMVSAIRDAVQACPEARNARGKPSVIDTKVTVKFDSLGTPSQKGYSPPKLFKAKVEKVAPAAAASNAFDDEESF